MPKGQRTNAQIQKIARPLLREDCVLVDLSGLVASAVAKRDMPGLARIDRTTGKCEWRYCSPGEIFAGRVTVLPAYAAIWFDEDRARNAHRARDGIYRGLIAASQIVTEYARPSQETA